MNKTNKPINRIAIGLAFAISAALTGCEGYVGGAYDTSGGYYNDGGVYGGTVVTPGPEVVVAEPDVYVFGGVSERGRDVHQYSHRGVESRAATRPVRKSAPPAAGRNERKR